MNGQAISQALKVWGGGHNPDGLATPDDDVELPPVLWRRMMRGEISAHDARREAVETASGRRAFNDKLRAGAGFGMEASSEEFLEPVAGPPAADLDQVTADREAMRKASLEVLGAERTEALFGPDPAEAA